MKMDHPPNERKGVPQSPLWQQGNDDINLANPNHRAWRCRLCIQDYPISFKHDATSNAWKHLDRVQNANLDNVIAQKRLREEDDIDVEEEVQSSPQEWRYIWQIQNSFEPRHLRSIGIC